MVDVSCERFQTLEIGTLGRHSDVPNPKVSALVGITSVYENMHLCIQICRAQHTLWALVFPSKNIFQHTTLIQVDHWFCKTTHQWWLPPAFWKKWLSEVRTLFGRISRTCGSGASPNTGFGSHVPRRQFRFKSRRLDRLMVGRFSRPPLNPREATGV